MSMTANFGFKKNDTVIYFAQLSHNKDRELFFRFLWRDIKPSYFYDGVKNTEHDGINMDHISFHKDGTVHLKLKDSSNKSDKIFHHKLKNTILAMPQDVYLPLLILSLYNVGEFIEYVGKSSPLIYNDGNNISYFWEIENKNQFSLVFFLVGGEVNHQIMLSTHFHSIFNTQASPMLLNYFGEEDKAEIANGEIKRINDVGLLIGYSERVIPRPSSDQLLGKKKRETVERIQNVYGYTITPTDDMIIKRLGNQ